MTKAIAGLFINRLEFRSGAELFLEDNSIVVLVGPNNSGKSLSLKEIKYISSRKNASGNSIKSIGIQRYGSETRVLETLQPFARKEGTTKYEASPYKSVTPAQVRELWNSDEPYVGDVSEFFIGHLTTERRLLDCASVDNFDAINHARGTHPIHQLYQDYDLEKRVSSLFARAFGKDLVVHRSAGRTIPLYVGERPQLSDGRNLVSRDYLDEVEKLEPLADQGDGLKSFASLLLSVWTGCHTILLLDEPEAFLHPPQAKAVGELISAGAEYEKQIFIATHSNDVIQGLLDRYAERISVVRLDREIEGVHATYLPNAQVMELWRDPILRYSNVLNGLFHSRVVVTESDGDCRFYEAVAETQPQDLRTTFYTYAGGKDRIPTLVRALRALHVPVRSVVDFDIFANDHPLRAIVEAHGGDWSQVSNDVNQVRNVVQSKKGWLIGSGFKSRISDIVKSIPDDLIVQKNVLLRIRSVLREASLGETIKAAGMAAVPSGEPTKRAQKLLDQLRAIDIFVVPEGEMEGFCRSIGAHGPRWVEEVLSRDLASDPELEDARNFVILLNSAGLDFTELKGTRKPISQRVNRRNYFRLHSALNLYLQSVSAFAKLVFFAGLGSYLLIQGSLLLFRLITAKQT